MIPTKIVASLAGDMAKKTLNALIKKAADEYLNGKVNGTDDTGQKKNATSGDMTGFVVDKIDGVMNRVFKNTPVEDVNTDDLAKKVVDDMVNEKVRHEVDEALYRLSTIATSLEKADEHQMVSDIMALVNTSADFTERDKMLWVGKLYGQNNS